MTEVAWGIVLFAALMAVYTLGWLAGHDHCSRWSQKETLDTTIAAGSVCPRCGIESLPANSSRDYCPSCGHEWKISLDDE